MPAILTSALGFTVILSLRSPAILFPHQKTEQPDEHQAGADVAERPGRALHFVVGDVDVVSTGVFCVFQGKLLSGF